LTILYCVFPRRCPAQATGKAASSRSGIIDPIGTAGGQNPTNDQKQEQTVFDAEPDPDVMHISKPVEIPDSALEALRDTILGGPANCLKSRGVTPEQASASWFLASAVHLNGPNEVDLVVLLNEPVLGNPKNPGGCLLPANGNYFWVLGPGSASGRYRLLLESYGHRLEVLNSRTNRYRDIQIGFASTVGNAAALYKFTLSQYQRAETK
jgi:hypothetical protein